MTIKRIVSLIMAVLMVFSVFTMTAVAAVEPVVETTSAGHTHRFVKNEPYSRLTTEFENRGVNHEIMDIYLTVCIYCNEYGEYAESAGFGNHFGPTVDLVEQHHSGVTHYYTYSHICDLCGGSYTETNSEYCGNPCGGAHLSVPDENI